MRYAMLIYTSETDPATLAAMQQGTMFQEYAAFEGWLAQRGGKLGGEALQPTMTATTVRVRDGKRTTTDGPFAETKEQLGGFYLIEAANLDEATEIAARIPGATYGAIEVRPIMDVAM